MKLSAIILSLCFLSSNAQQSDPGQTLKPVGDLVDIGGWKMHIIGKGVHRQGMPSVIFENGIRGFSFDWTLIQDSLSSFVRNYSYDRAGSAWSELGPSPYTMQQTGYNLHALLEKGQIPPPYILVGASHGGLLVRMFAQMYPEKVAGVLLVELK